MSRQVPRPRRLTLVVFVVLVLVAAIAHGDIPPCKPNMLEKVLAPTYSNPAHQLCMKDSGMDSKVFLSAEFSPTLAQLGAFFKSESCRATFQLIVDAIKNDLPTCMYSTAMSSTQLGNLTFDHLRTLYTAYMASL
ncbi:hypothetical protein H310_10206 [Aphanomyces invadans]|nr:hypothetical protein H310_10206 [Aphanomyces invadans]ETV96454.1 hypothetical protein H310_10206 [Aphanomyces invadans]|eukprot:XP_008874717.1 hypothetical protein H310_10206 [Aphanomyces invadans]